MTYKLFIDDERYPPISWLDSTTIICRSSKEATDCINERGLPEFISFDHDLGIDHYNQAMYSNDPEDYNTLYKTFSDKTGYHCAQWVVEYCISNNLTFPDYVCHSMNPVGIS